MLRSLDWRSLEQRRVDSRLTILYKIQNHLVAIDTERHRATEVPISPVESRQGLHTLFFLSQDSHTVEPASKSNLQSHSIPSRPKSRRSSTLDSIRPKHFFYLFAFLLLYLLLSFRFPTTLTHLFLYFYYHFPSRTPLVIILKLRAYQYDPVYS